MKFATDINIDICKMKTAVTAYRIRELFDYNCVTGRFTTRYRRPGPVKGWIIPGTTIGSIETNGYEIIMVDGLSYKSHRLAWLWFYGCWPKKQIDHINGVKADNIIVNLRLATSLQNSRYAKKSKANTSGFKGVSWANRHKSWMSRIRVEGKSVFLGMHKEKGEAAKAYDRAALHFFGQFAKTNRSLGLLI